MDISTVEPNRDGPAAAAAAVHNQSSAPVHQALHNGDISLALDLLNNGASVHGRGKRNMALLHVAAMNGFKSVAEILLRKGAAVDPIEDDFWTPLHLASGHGHTFMVELLLFHGAGIDIQDDEGWTALHQAADSHPEVVKLLLDRGANPSLQTSDGKTPLDLARERNNVAICKMLMEHSMQQEAGEAIKLCEACKGITYTSLNAPERELPESVAKRLPQGADPGNRAIKGYVHSQSYNDLIRSSSSCALCMHILHSLIYQKPEPENGPICLHFEENGASEGHMFVSIRVADQHKLFAKDNKLGVTADEGSAAAVHGGIITRPFPPNALNLGNIETIKRWLTLCQESHESCRITRNHVKPKRLLDLNPQGSRYSYVLVDTAHIPEEEISWAALTYCWGTKPALISERATIATFQHPNGISLEDSPKTYQDAVHAVRSLGIRYLWIDALCITQDDSDEWKAEATKMADIYRNAKVTIAATGSLSTNAGFLITRKNSDFIKLFYDGPGSKKDKGDRAYKRIIRKLRKKDTNDYFYVHVKHPGISASVETTTWNKRGWTMQERFLSRNIVHFTSGPLVLECRAGSWTEHHTANNADWLALPDKKSRAHTIDGNMVLDVQRPRFISASTDISDWHGIVAEFCNRSFTFPDDKTWAIEGIVQEFKRHTGLEYLDGVWLNVHAEKITPDVQAAINRRQTEEFQNFNTEQGISAVQDGANGFAAWYNSLHCQILWCVSGPLRSRPRTRAPSWSWLNIDGKLFHFSLFAMERCVPYAAISFEKLQFSAEPAQMIQCMRIRSQARMVQRSTCATLGDNYGNEKPNGGNAAGDIYRYVYDWYRLSAADGVLDASDGVAGFDVDDPSDGPFLAVRIADKVGTLGERGLVRALLLQEERSEGISVSVYRRVGVAEFHDPLFFCKGGDVDVLVM